MVTLQVKRPIRLTIDRSILQNAAQTTLDITEPGKQFELSLVIADDHFVRNLNYQYRKVDASTDVLSFPAGEIDPDTADYYLGDVIISLPKAREQAAADSHSLADELQLLVVHGVLHLLGYDHLDASDRKKMQAAQDEILMVLDIDLRITLQ